MRVLWKLRFHLKLWKREFALQLILGEWPCWWANWVKSKKFNHHFLHLSPCSFMNWNQVQSFISIPLLLLTCPQCVLDFQYDHWTKLNYMQNPSVASHSVLMLIPGTAYTNQMEVAGRLLWDTQCSWIFQIIYKQSTSKSNENAWTNFPGVCNLEYIQMYFKRETGGGQSWAATQQCTFYMSAWFCSNTS